VNFEDWYDENLKTMLKEHNLHSALEWAWKTAQEAERERVTAIMMKYIHDDNYAYWNEAVRAYWNEAVKAAVGGINELP
jgi:hypothetical protein